MSEFKLMSFVYVTMKEIEKNSLRNVANAAKHLRKRIREKLSNRAVSAPGNPPGMDSGNLKKGVRYVVDREKAEAKVGFARPAYHYILMEKGTVDRTVKETGKTSGYVAPRPVLEPTLIEEKENIKKILQGKLL